MKKITKWFFASIFSLYLILLIPDSKEKAPQASTKQSFSWNRDFLWKNLEQEYQKEKLLPDSVSKIKSQQILAELKTLDSLLKINEYDAESPVYDSIQQKFFRLAVCMAAHPSAIDSCAKVYASLRYNVKNIASKWNMNYSDSKFALYTTLYGLRAAMEEVYLRVQPEQAVTLQVFHDEPSETPSAMIEKAKVHSGDILVSRGGADVSAFIARGNDFAGNFSHVAMVYVDEKTNTPYLIEAHIEKGVAVSTVEKYLSDTKLRVLQLRPRADLELIKNDPMLPHKAALTAFREAEARHIAYDFKMNYIDSSAMFCSEVVSYGYRKNGLQLWQQSSTISSQGMINWLHAFGVENFTTQMPSDLEYDPQLMIVAEYFDANTLFQDHVYNAIMDVLYERADNGMEVKYNHALLPFARGLKFYCMILNFFGKQGIIPEGMTATQALRNYWFSETYLKMRTDLDKKVAIFQQQNNYLPPYWELVNLARKSADELVRE